MLKVIKRLNESQRSMHALLRASLVHCQGWLDIESDPGAGSFGVLVSGSDGETLPSAPTVFNSPAGLFSPAHIGLYLALGGPTTPFGMKGLYRIVAVQSSTALVVASGLYGAAFPTSLNVEWAIIDPSLNVGVGDTSFVVQAPSGTSTPAWQARFFFDAITPTQMQIEVGPWGGWSVGTGWTNPFIDAAQIATGTGSIWYFLIDDTGVLIIKENGAGTAVDQIAYAGTGVPRRPDVDDHFAISYVGNPATGAIDEIGSIAADGSTVVYYEALVLGDDVVPDVFDGLANSPFDVRRDVSEIAIACEIVGSEENDRGTLRGLAFVSNTLAYRSFVDNGRSWLSLGSCGLAVLWDGSIAT